METSTINHTLEQQRKEFSDRRLLAMPLAGLTVWLVIGIAAFVLPITQTVWALFIGTGSIAYLGIFISKFTGEDFLAKDKPKNTFDRLFFLSVGMSLMVYTIAIPFFIIDYSSLPLTVGILSGLMWMPVSWIIQHWIGLFHTIARTVLIVSAWYLFPQQRFTTIPFIIVSIYIITIIVLEIRWRNIHKTTI